MRSQPQIRLLVVIVFIQGKTLENNFLKNKIDPSLYVVKFTYESPP